MNFMIEVSRQREIENGMEAQRISAWAEEGTKAHQMLEDHLMTKCYVKVEKSIDDAYEKNRWGL